MSKATATPAKFLSALNLGGFAEDGPDDQPAPTAKPKDEAPATPPKPKADAATPVKRGRPAKRTGGTRQGLKHIGGYVDDETAEKFALLKIRLKVGNDDLLKMAIENLYVAEQAKRAWNK